MCYLVRQQPADAAFGAVPPAPAGERLRPRWAAALTAALVGGVALAATLVVSPAAAPEAPAPVAKQGALLAPVVARTVNTPAAGGSERAGLPVDDDVPTAPASDKAALGGCHHDL